MNIKQHYLFKNITPIINSTVHPIIFVNLEIVRCRVCGRILKNDESKLIGMGETCRHKIIHHSNNNCTVTQIKLV